MTSVRTCYCKHERNAPCKEDNHVGAHKEKRHPAIVENEACRSNEELTIRKMRSIADENTPPDPVLSPETSTVLENAEKIIGDARIRLVEICGMSRPDSARRNVNTYSDDPPLDDEAEELQYIRQLVACKFHELNSSRCEDARSGRASSGELVGRVDLSAAKFRMPQQRRQRDDDWSSLEHGRDTDDRESRERAALTEAPSKDEDETTRTRTRNDRARDRRRAPSSSPAECELVRARGNACRIQMGPSLHIVHRELSKQDLEDVHISPEPSRVRSRANTATYALRHDIVGSSVGTSVDNEAEMSRRTPRTVIRARLNPLRKEEQGRLIDPAAEQAETIASIQVSAKRVGEIGDFASGPDGEWIESSKSREHIMHEARNDREAEEMTGVLASLAEPARPMMNRAAVNYSVTADARNGNGKSKRGKKGNENQAEVTVRDDDTGSCYAEESGGTSNKRSDIDEQGGTAADEIREEKQNDRSKPAFLAGDDAPRKTGCPRRENITSSRCRATESAIDECFSNTYDSHSEQTTALRDVACDENLRRRSFIPRSYPSDLDEVDLYRPRLDDLDSILLSNEERLERVTRAASDFAELLSRPEFLKYRLNDDEKQVARENSGEFYRDSVAIDKEDTPLANEPIRSSTMETELRNVDLTISRSSETRRVDASLRKGDTTGTKSSQGSDDDDSQNSIESSVHLTLQASEGIGSFRDEARRVQVETHSSDTLMDKSDDVTTFSNMLPALSSTRTTEIRTCRSRDDQPILQNDHRADGESRAALTNRSLRRDVDRFPERQRSDDDVLSQVFRGLKDTSGSTADRVVTYILQDEKQCLERKVTSALKGSAITPRAVQNLLDRLREVESIRSTQRTETLSILKDILISVKSETKEEDAEDAKKLEDEEISSRASNELPRLSAKVIRANRTTSNEIAELSSRQTQKTIDTGEVEQITTRNPQDLTRRDNDSSNVSVNREEDVRGSVRSETRSEAAPKNDSKGDACSEAESLKQIPDIRSDDEDEDPGRNSGQLSTRITSARSHKRTTDDADVAALENEEEKNKNPAEDIMQATEIKHFVDSRSNIIEASVAAKEITMEETRDNIAPMIKPESPILSAMLKMKEPVQSDASSFSAKFLLGKVLREKNIAFVHSSAREDDGSPRATKIDINLQQPAEKTTKKDLSPTKSCSLDSRRNCTSLSSVKNSKSPLKKIASPEQISFNIKGDDNSTRSTRNENGGEPTTRIETENGGFGLLKRTEDDNEERLINKMNSLRENKTDVTSKVIGSSTSSVSSTLLDHDERYINGLSGARVKVAETSSETCSHSEGELYMPSSCSYSLGEVRMLRKRDSIADSATDRRDSVTLLVTKSMLTSLNDSTTSSVGNSGRV